VRDQIRINQLSRHIVTDVLVVFVSVAVITIAATSIMSEPILAGVAASIHSVRSIDGKNTHHC
jgi:hypothetical protein